MAQDATSWVTSWSFNVGSRHTQPVGSCRERTDLMVDGRSFVNGSVTREGIAAASCRNPQSVRGRSDGIRAVEYRVGRIARVGGLDAFEDRHDLVGGRIAMNVNRTDVDVLRGRRGVEVLPGSRSKRD